MGKWQSPCMAAFLALGWQWSLGDFSRAGQCPCLNIGTSTSKIGHLYKNLGDSEVKASDLLFPWSPFPCGPTGLQREGLFVSNPRGYRSWLRLVDV